MTRERPLPAVLRALAELATHAGDAAAIGKPWPVDRLLRSARSYVANVRVRPEDHAPPPRPREPKAPRAPEPPPVRPDPAALFAAVAKGEARRPT